MSLLDRRFPRVTAVIALGVIALTPVIGKGPNFRADYLFQGASLQGWRVSGQTEWKARDGVITAAPKAGNGGWLILDRSLADVAFYADIHCTAGCKAGVLLRGEKTPGGGIKGVYVSFSEADLGSYSVVVDGQGREISRERLPAGNSEGGLRSTSGNTPPEIAKALTGPVPPPPGIRVPDMTRPSGDYRPGEWNQLEIILYGNALKPAVNGGPYGGKALASSIAAEQAGKCGAIALYVGGSGEAQFRDLRYKDLLKREVPVERVSSHFRMHRLSTYYFSWSAAVADINRDGIQDVIAGPYYYLGPAYGTAIEFYTPVAYNPTADYPQVSIVNLAYDFTGDGWPDLLLMSGNAGVGTGTLYVNPKGESRHWDAYVVVKPVNNEETLLKDIDGDGKPEVIHACNNALCYSKPDPANPTGKWITRTISEPGPWGLNIGHGLGVGDINGDGRMDYLNVYGWWEQPRNGSSQELWTYHPQPFGRWGASAGGPGGAELGVYDVNGDGLNDVVASLEGHGFGLAWYEQKRNQRGEISFVEHMIMDNFLTHNAGNVIFTEPHVTAFADMDGDGIPDLITGKSPLHHLFGYSDPDPFGPPVLYWYRTVRNPKAPGGAEFVPELIHNRSGVGAHMVVTDLNDDGAPDIVISNTEGTFVFFNDIKRARPQRKSDAQRGLTFPAVLSRVPFALPSR